MSKSDKSRGLRDEANVGPDPRRARELRPLKDMKWQVADGEPDIRGWSVFASTGRELGVVEELLVDSEAREVVMLDVDLKRDDRHTLAPLRAAWIDRETKRVVIDARELAAADSLPALPRVGALSDDDIERFNDGYVRAYGARGYEADQPYRLRRGDDEIQFGAAPLIDRRAPTEEREAPRRLLDDGPVLEESRAINRELAGLPTTDDAAIGDPSGGIEPRELDARVRIDEGATVDDDTPVAGVRYPDAQHPSHSYGALDDAERRERVVSRHPHIEADAAEVARRLGETSDGRVRYRNYAQDAGRPDDVRP